MATATSPTATPITLTASCHCGGFTARYTLPASAFPLEAAICSCDSCRRVSGQLFATFTMIPAEQRPTGATMTPYAFTRNLTSYFCSVCGASIANMEPWGWDFATGVLSVARGGGDDETPEGTGTGTGIQGLLDRQCLFVGDTMDGGGVLWMPDVNSAGLEMKKHAEHRESPVVDVEKMSLDFATRIELDERAMTAEKRGAEERLHARCHCGAVRFYITRPSPSNPPAGDSKRGKWWLGDPDDSACTKYKAQLDACNSCRLVTGFEVNAWAFIPPCNVFAEVVSAVGAVKAKPFDLHDKSLNLTHYSSSKGVWRSFCKTCGATVSYCNGMREVQILDFGVGLFRGNGARCEDWFQWKGVEFAEDATDQKFVNDLEARAGKGEH